MFGDYLIWLLVLVPLIIGVFFWKNKLIFRVDTLFRKGFKKNNDNYGIYCWVGKQRRWQNLFSM